MPEMLPIFVADDEALILMDMVECLQAGGFVVQDFASSSEIMAAIETATELQGLVTDVRLGGDFDGWAVACRAREKFPDLPIVYVTGDSFNEWTAKGVPCSVILQKPFAHAQLTTAIANLISEAAAKRSPAAPPND